MPKATVISGAKALIIAFELPGIKFRPLKVKIKLRLIDTIVSFQCQ